jgi:hypothetical protein
VCGDSLLHGSVKKLQHFLGDWDPLEHTYQPEDRPALVRLLEPGSHHAVVANPPYITPKDRALNQAYRDRYSTCHMKYSLAVPFLERIVSLAVDGGFTGQITANSFMKREFGKKLIEQFFPRIDLTHVIDTSGAYVPGHGTPTVILLARNRKPVASTLRTVMGIRGEPATPEDASKGLVWSAIIAQIDEPGSRSDYVSVEDSPREVFNNHPWSIGGGGAAELKEQLETVSPQTLFEVASDLGYFGIAADDVMMAPVEAFKRKRLEGSLYYNLITGDQVRDWAIERKDAVLLPYSDGVVIQISRFREISRWMWPARTLLGNRPTFSGRTYFEDGRLWWDWHQVTMHRLTNPFFICYASVATHNQFALRSDDSLLNRHAPIVLLPTGSGKSCYFGILGLLNSSTACFWMKQVFHDKGSTVDSHGARQTTVAFENFREFTGTGLLKFPVSERRPTELARQLDELGQNLQSHAPGSVLQRWERRGIMPGSTIKESFERSRLEWIEIRERMISLQEELDWDCYRLYGLIDEDLTYGKEPPPLRFGWRAFEIAMQPRIASGELQTTWFERHNATALPGPHPEWPQDYQELVRRRMEVIATNRNIALIEQPEYKRRWNTEPWDEQLARALRSWLLDRLEAYFDFDGRMKGHTAEGGCATVERTDTAGGGFASMENKGTAEGGCATMENPGTAGGGCASMENKDTAEGGCASRENEDTAGGGCATARLPIALVSVGRLADFARRDSKFREVGALYREDEAFDVTRLVSELTESESLPLLPILRYKPSGLRKRAEWEKTWDLQRQEDAIDARAELPKDDPEFLTEPDAAALKKDQVGTIPVPPKYTSADFLKSNYWRLRGKLDVPKERWVSFPHCEGEDGTLMVAWAGYDHLQLARAISAHYVDVQERLGGREDPRLVPLLACVIELLPWLKQWHNEVDSEFGMPMGDYFEGFVQEESRNMGLTLEEIRSWQPPERTRVRRARRTT